MTDKQVLTIRVDNLGAFVTEAVRAYLHQGAPSALVSRVVAGLTEAASELKGTDGYVVDLLHAAMSDLVGVMRAHEDRLYEDVGGPPCNRDTVRAPAIDADFEH